MMGTSKHLRAGLFAAIAAAGLLGVPAESHANHDALNLHLESGLGLPASGNLAPPSKFDNLAHLGLKFWLAADYEVLDFLAIEAIAGIGSLIELDKAEPNLDNKLLYSLGIGGRFRLPHADTGGASSSLASNLWASAHLGLIGVTGPQFGLDGAIGYEIPIGKTLALGPFVRGELALGDIEGRKAASAVYAGVSLAFGAKSRGGDTDGDGLTDSAEKNRHNTDPNNPDTDGDGLNDGLEVRTGTNPLDPDTDRGGLRDGTEDANGNGVVDPGETDPRVKDGREVATDDDNDGVRNDVDACPDTPAGSKVNDKGCVEFVGTTFTLEGVRFETGSAAILPESEPTLLRAVAVMKDNPGVRVEIGGHTDSRGKAAMNRLLSLDRAKAVKDYLVRAGIDASRMTTKGYGPSQPVGDNATEEGRAQNRRIEFKRLDN